MSYRTLQEEIKVLEQGLPPQEGDGFIGGRLDPEEASLVLIDFYQFQAWQYQLYMA